MASDSQLAAQAPEAATEPYRVMVVDDSAVIRGIFRRTLDVDPEITVVASVSNGQHALDSMARQPVDVIVLDIEMPVMDGMTALPKLLKADPNVKIIMASTLTQANADISLSALQAGASDYIPKPSARHEIHSAEAFKRELVEKVKALGHARKLRLRRRAAPAEAETPDAVPSPAPRAAPAEPAEPGITLREPSNLRPRILCIGSSTGGPNALMQVVAELKGNFDLPIVITQHMPKTFTPILAEHLQRVSGRPSCEASNGQLVESGHIYVAPGGIHMVLTGSAEHPVIKLDDGPAENFCKPAVDPMLRSVSRLFRDRVLTVILTGMGHDGCAGSRVVADAGGTVIAQDEASSVVWGMPGAVANAGICSFVAPLPGIVQHIRKLSGKPAL